MKQEPQKTELVFVQNDKSVTSSRLISKTFGKRHDHVLRDIKNLSISNEFRLPNFGESSYKNAQGKEQPEFIITKDGFTMLAMGYTGEKAMQFKEAYIKRFNEMESLLKHNVQLPQNGSYVDGKPYVVKLDKHTSFNVFSNGIEYTRYTSLAKYLGYEESGAATIRKKIKPDYIVKFILGKQDVYFISYEGFLELLEYIKKPISKQQIINVKRDLFGETIQIDAYVFKFTSEEMHFIIQKMHEKPVNKGDVINLLYKGKQ